MNTFDTRVSDQIGTICKITWATEFCEILVIGEEGMAVLTASDEIVATSALPSDITIVDQQRTPQGWRVLVYGDSVIRILSIPSGGSPDVILSGTVTEPHTACWNPCGNLLAVGSIGTELSVWNTNSGLMHWKRSIAWYIDEFLTPPTLSIKGWTPDGARIVTTAEYLAAITCNVWDADSGELVTSID